MTLRTAIFAAAAIALLQMGALAQSSKMYRVGLISVRAPDSGILGPGMVRDFAKRGYALDRNIVFERRAAEGRFERVRNFLSSADTKRTHRG
jgi:putative ABC transport system substrate-binding protein